MQLFKLRGVEIDRCIWCGGVYFDAGEIDEAGAGAAALTLYDDVVDVRCPECAVEMSSAELSRIPAYGCGQCRGIYVQGSQLEALVGEAQPEPLEREALTFRCEGCGQEFPIEDGMASGHGLCCARCFGRPTAGALGFSEALDAYPDPLLATRKERRRAEAQLQAEAAGDLMALVFGPLIDLFSKKR